MILVTGASGYLGRKVCEVLKARGVEYVAPTRSVDLTNDERTGWLLVHEDPTRIIHCAAEVPKSLEAYGDVAAGLRSVSMAQNLARHALCPITFASSLTAAKPSSAYAWSKLAAETVIKARQRPDDVILRLPGLYGLPRRNGFMYEAAVALSAPHWVAPAHDGHEWEVMHVEDAAEWLVSGRPEMLDGPEVSNRTHARWLQFVEDVRQDLLVRTP